MISDLDVLKNERISGSEAGISARLLQGIYGPPDKEKNPVAEQKSGGFMATLMEVADDQLYGQKYAQTLRGAEKTEEKPQPEEAKVPTGFPTANIVTGDNGYIDFGVSSIFGDKQDAKQIVDNRVAA